MNEHNPSMHRRSALKILGLSAMSSAFVRPTSLYGSEIGQSQLRAAAQYSAAHTGVSFLAMKGGKVLFEDYPNGSSPRDMFKIYSGTKGFWILSALKAV